MEGSWGSGSAGEAGWRGLGLGARAGHLPSSRVVLLSPGGSHKARVMPTHPREHRSIVPLCRINILTLCARGQES